MTGAVIFKPVPVGLISSQAAEEPERRKMLSRSASFLAVLSLAASLAGCEGSGDEAVKRAERGRIAAEARAAAAEKALAEREAIEKKHKPAPALTGNKTVQDAKAELQGRIDRYLGGQKDPAQLGILFPINAVTTAFDKIDVENVLQKYDEQGNAVPNQFVATFTASGSDRTTGQPRVKKFQLFELAFRDGKWEVR